MVSFLCVGTPDHHTTEEPETQSTSFGCYSPPEDLASCVAQAPSGCGSSSLAEAVWPLGQHLDAVKALPRGDVKRLFAGPGKGSVCHPARHLDVSEILALGVEYLDTGHGGEVEAVVAI